jgi:Flp pilus assembly protein TadG
MRRARARQGQSLVEFALVLPVLVVMLLGLFDAGRAVIGYTTISNAARVGARVAIVNQSNDASCPDRVADPSAPLTFKCAAAAQTTGLGVSPASIPDLVVTGTGCPEIGCDVTVTVNYVYQPITPVIGNLIGTISLVATETMKIEHVGIDP